MERTPNLQKWKDEKRARKALKRRNLVAAKKRLPALREGDKVYGGIMASTRANYE